MILIPLFTSWRHLNFVSNVMYENISVSSCVPNSYFLQLVFLQFVFDTCVIKCSKSPWYPSLYSTSYQGGGLTYSDNIIFHRDYAWAKFKERFLFSWYGQEEQVPSLDLTKTRTLKFLWATQTDFHETFIRLHASSLKNHGKMYSLGTAYNFST